MVMDDGAADIHYFHDRVAKVYDEARFVGFLWVEVTDVAWHHHGKALDDTNVDMVLARQTGDPASPARIRTKIRYSRRNDTAHDHASIAAARRSPQVTSAANFWNQTGRTARHSDDPDTVAGDRVERQRVGLVRDRGVVVGVRRGGAASKCSVSIVGIGSRAVGASAAEP
ncbi:hypothetical protein [Saccharopolyspora shandongensis]|uniref:hypothetical protein n=1 Tax=Saccharopolyspora shandongensis TaxID=418495 RepID=UPI0033F06E97